MSHQISQIIFSIPYLSLKSVVENVEVFVVLKPKDKDETWTNVWGTEIDEHANGKKDTIALNENWMFNKDGKVAYINQFSSKMKM